MRSVWIFALCLIFSGCSSPLFDQKTPHGFHLKNVGSTRISNIEIRYGDFYKRFCENGCGPKFEVFWGVSMPLQETAVVSWWSVNKQRIEVQVPVRSKVNDVSRLAEIYLAFDDEALTVAQSLKPKGFGMVGLERIVYFSKQ